MTDKETGATPTASGEEAQPGWRELTLKVAQLQAEVSAVANENKSLRLLLERVIGHWQKSHTDLVLIMANLVGKLPLNDVGVIVSKLVEHNTNASQFGGGLANSAGGALLPQPELLKTLDQNKRDIAAALKPAVEERSSWTRRWRARCCQSLLTQPDLFFSPPVVRGNRCFVKGYVPRERILREFGEEALVFFNDLTTDPKLNPRPNRRRSRWGSRTISRRCWRETRAWPPPGARTCWRCMGGCSAAKRPPTNSRAQRHAFQRMSFLIELLHYYEHSDTEAPDLLFAQRLPGLIEQLAMSGSQDRLDEKLIVSAEALLAFVVNPDHRLMIINNVGKGGGMAKTLKFILRLRAAKAADTELDQVDRRVDPALAPG